VYHFSPAYTYTPGFLDGYGYGVGKSDTPWYFVPRVHYIHWTVFQGCARAKSKWLLRPVFAALPLLLFFPHDNV
jgi:hypothetical protein